MQSQPISSDHVNLLWDVLKETNSALPISHPHFIEFFARNSTWKEPGMAALFGAFLQETLTVFTPLVPVIGALSPPHYFSKTDPALALYLINNTPRGPEIPFASVIFADGRRMLQIQLLLLDTAGKRTKYTRNPEGLISTGTPQAFYRLAKCALESFPRISPEGEKFRAEALKNLPKTSAP